MRYIFATMAAWLMLGPLYAQTGRHPKDTSLTEVDLDEVIISANKWEQKINEVPNKIVKINRLDIIRNNPQTAADLLGQTGSVFIQKSQLGGGSPMIRGFATNRILLVVDGVRMNNAIYRSGNLQNVISIDPLSQQTAEVIFGPGSLIYGSDAIGGVMDFHSIDPRFYSNKKWMLAGSAVTRYASANNEKTLHVDFNLAGKKISFLSSATYSEFDDLKMGKHGGDDSYGRPQYIERINGIDSILTNPNPRVQKFSGYEQLNILNKIRFRPSAKWDMQYGFTFAETGNAPRYDRLIQYRNGKLRFAEWYYGPMIWRMHNLHIKHSQANILYNESKLVMAYQDYDESRVDRPRASNIRTRQSEKVRAYSINWDALKKAGIGEVFYGLEYVYNKVGSFGSRTDIGSNIITKYISRYPNGSSWSTAGIYGSYKVNLHKKLTFSAGARYTYNSLSAVFDTSFLKFPFADASIKDGSLIGNLGLVFRPSSSWQLNGHISSGYRMPNIDDIGKIFESVPGNVSIPNPNLTPEYAWNFELGVVRNIEKIFRMELTGFYSLLDNAIVRRPTLLNGQDSIIFEGINSRVESLQNVARATVYGLQLSTDILLCPGLNLVSHANLVKGKETDDIKNEQVPLRHAAPFYGSSLLKYQYKRIFIEGSVLYNSQVKNKNLAPTEQAKKEIYAKDADGKPYSPGWHTVNLKMSCQLNSNLTVTGAWENISNQRYRPYSSGIVAAGSNLLISLRASLK